MERRIFSGLVKCERKTSLKFGSDRLNVDRFGDPKRVSEHLHSGHGKWL